MISLQVNGRNHHLDIAPETPLLWALNEHLGLTGTKYSCGIGECGACTVLINGKAARSCTITAGQTEGLEVTTIEGFHGPLAVTLRSAWLKEDVAQCGYCQPAQILNAAMLFIDGDKPSEEQINATMNEVLCRCGTYGGIRRAINIVQEEYCHDQTMAYKQPTPIPSDLTHSGNGPGPVGGHKQNAAEGQAKGLDRR